MDPLLVSVEEAANALGIGRSEMYELLASSEVPSVKIGRRRLVSRRALDEYVGRLEAASGPAQAPRAVPVATTTAA